MSNYLKIYTCRLDWSLSRPIFDYTLYMLQCNKFDSSNANKWLQIWSLVNNSPAAFTCNYFAHKFNLLDIKVLLNERALDNDL